MTRAAELLAVALAGSVAFGGCSISRPTLERQFFVVKAERTGAPAGVRKPVALKVGLISVAPIYSGRSITYRVGELRYESDPYAAFFAAPRDLVASAVAEWLAHAQLFAVVRAPSSPVGAPYVLEGLVTELYGDMHSARQAAAVVAIHFYLHTEIDRNNPIFERAYSQRIDVSDGSAAAMMQAYGTALARILAQLEHDLAVVALP